jgi:hypothetical protein
MRTQKDFEVMLERLKRQGVVRPSQQPARTNRDGNNNVIKKKGR